MEDKKQYKGIKDQKNNVPNKEIPPELKEKFEQIKKKLDTFKERILKNFEDYIIGIALLPPKKFIEQRFSRKDFNANEQKEIESNTKKENPNEINIFVLVDDSDSKKMSKFELRD